MFLQIFIDFVKGISKIPENAHQNLFLSSNAMSLSPLDVQLGEIMVGKCIEATNIMRPTGHYWAKQMLETFIELKGFRSFLSQSVDRMIDIKYYTDAVFPWNRKEMKNESLEQKETPGHRPFSSTGMLR